MIVTTYSQTTPEEHYRMMHMQATEYNIPASIMNLGWCYQEGYGTKQNIKNAALCYKKAANLNLIPAKCAYLNLQKKYRGLSRLPNQIKLPKLTLLSKKHVSSSNLLNLTKSPKINRLDSELKTKENIQEKMNKFCKEIRIYKKLKLYNLRNKKQITQSV